MTSKWGLFRRFAVRDSDGDVYLWRLRIIESPWFGLYLHHIRKPDPDRHLHDHPWDFVSIVLLGWYDEFTHPAGRAAEETLRRVRWFNFKRAETMHQIAVAPYRGAWTLVMRARRRRSWGFLTSAGWVEWFAYIARRELRPEELEDNTWTADGREVLLEHSCPECGKPIWLRDEKSGMVCRSCAWRTFDQPERMVGLEHGHWGCSGALSGYHGWTRHRICAFCGIERNE